MYDHFFLLSLTVQPGIGLGVQLIVPGKPEPDYMVSALLQIQAVSTAGGMRQQDVDLPRIPIILIPGAF